ncbi:hypothetical protein J132_09646 [Termitomyces sp. J132]|nr:hypothetical protein C0989_001835 [Termitomyces sp. Mn162]KNZ73744.1 hypothetical protein J132_09646 [Termitomyces sp. J132]
MVSLRFALLAAFTGTAVAQTSLYIPGFDPQPISADILGVDAQGRTTWALHQGALTDTFEEGSFPGTATLVEGTNDVSMTYVAPSGLFTMGTECTLSDGLAICSATVSGEPVTETDTVNFIDVQAGTTAVLTSPTATTVPVALTSISSQPSQTGIPAQTSKNTSSAASPTQSSNAAVTFPHLMFGFIVPFAAAALAL